MPNNEKPWTKAEEDKFRTLWADPAMTVDEIALRLRRTKNSITGKRKRLKLPERENPIVKQAKRLAAQQAAPNRPFTFGKPLGRNAATLPPLPSETSE